VATPKDLPRDIGEFIRDLRRNARISLRQLAEQAGVSNPYLSQIERGLRKPSAEVLQQLAGALRVSTPLMYLRAGLLDAKEGQGVLAAIAADSDLSMAQKQSLTQIYLTFRRENERENGGPASRVANVVVTADVADTIDVADVADVDTAADPEPAHEHAPEKPAMKAVRKTARKAEPPRPAAKAGPPAKKEKS
jgi:transcriptional regulator with XRE-family HTH domain